MHTRPNTGRPATTQARPTAAFALVAAVCALALVSGCGSDERATPPASTLPRTRVLVADVPGAAALVALPDGGLLYGERLSGRVVQVDGDARTEVARVPVSTGGQRGLLGLAVLGDRVFAAYTDPARRVVVAQVAPGARREVWDGPPSSDLANGGHLAVLDDGRLLIGIGDLQHPDRTPDPAAPNGKLLALDPDGAPAQQPQVVSTGWNNPFAFAVLPDGHVWVADNVPGDSGERLTRGDVPRAGVGAPVTTLPTGTAPSGLAARSDTDLAVCGVRSGKLLHYLVGTSGRARPAGVLADDCSLGVVALSDGRYAYSTGTEIRVVTPG